MSHFDVLTKEERKIRDSIVLDRLKKELEFFIVPDGSVEKIDKILEDFRPYLKSDNKMEVAIAADCFNRVSGIKYVLNLLKNENK